ICRARLGDQMYQVYSHKSFPEFYFPTEYHWTEAFQWVSAYLSIILLSSSLTPSLSPSLSLFLSHSLPLSPPLSLPPSLSSSLSLYIRSTACTTTVYIAGVD